MTSLQVFVGYSHRDLCGNAWGADDAYISYRYAQNLMADPVLITCDSLTMADIQPF